METFCDGDEELQYCPICQVPSASLKILFHIHTSMCSVRWEDLPDCTDGAECCNENVFHYRDFSHKILANHRENVQKRKLEKICIKDDVNVIDDEAKENSRKVMKHQETEEDEDDIFVSSKNSKIVSDQRRRVQKLQVDHKSEKRKDIVICKSSLRKHKTKDNKFSTLSKSSKLEANTITQDQPSVESRLPERDDQSMEEPSVCTNTLDQENLTITSESNNESSTCWEDLTENLDETIRKREKSKAEWNNLFKNNSPRSSSSDAKPDKKKRSSFFGSAKETKVCPAFKKMPGTSFAVDAFQFGNIPGVTIYFLTHFHADHYIGLRKSFSNPIYCSLITANLVKKKLRVDEKYLHILELDSPIVINQVEVTCFDANHCPGAVIILFRLMNGEQFLHVGDFRACVEMESIPQLQTSHIDRLYLDTTYFNPEYVFPTQKEVVDRVKDIVRSKSTKYEKALFVSGTYSIGKEKVFIGMLEVLQCKLWAQPQKVDIFRCVNDPVILSALTSVPEEAKIHVLPMNYLRFDRLKKHLLDQNGAFTHIFAFKPTGWEMGRKAGSGDWLNESSNSNITIYGVPYSEHSNYEELCRFIKFIKADKVIPTVTMKNREMYGLLKSIVESYKGGPKQQGILKFFSSS